VRIYSGADLQWCKFTVVRIYSGAEYHLFSGTLFSGTLRWEGFGRNVLAGTLCAFAIQNAYALIIMFILADMKKTYYESMHIL
jgi:hypothetical protein